MPDPEELAARMTAAESRLDRVESEVASARADAAAARHLAAAHDRDVADLGVKVDANRRAVNALGEQTRANFDRLERKVDAGFAEMRGKFVQVDAGFAEMRGKFDQVDAVFAEMRGTLDQTAAGMEQIVRLLTDRDG